MDDLGEVGATSRLPQPSKRLNRPHTIPLPSSAAKTSTALERPSQIPVASFATSTSQAFVANARSTQDFHEAEEAEDPVEFYRNYRDVQTNATSTADVSPFPEPVKHAMASATPSRRPTPPSARSGSHGTGPKYPNVAAARNGIRPGARSVSSTIDDRSGIGAVRFLARGTTASPLPSVQDLKKRFDQSAAQTLTTARRVAQGSLTREATTSDATGRVLASAVPTGCPSLIGTAGTTGTTPRTTGTDSAKAISARVLQRPTYAAEDALSPNSRSFANRVGRPRNVICTATLPPSTMTSPSPNTSPRPLRTQRLSFGELLPGATDSDTAGFGMGVFPSLPSSELDAKDLAQARQRSFSEPDMEPQSPTGWYRNAVPAHQDKKDGEVGFNRSHAQVRNDTARSMLETGSSRLDAEHTTKSPETEAEPQFPTSRLPVITKKSNTSPDHGSPLSTPSSSPTPLQTASDNGRIWRQDGIPATRPNLASTQPVLAVPRSKSPQRPMPDSTPAIRRLNAAVTVPAPLSSPGLRSSRPRLSVAAATTAASRLRAAEKSMSPTRKDKAGHRTTPRMDTGTDDWIGKRRKIDVGPIDFAQRRETIKLAYTKSIKETQAGQARLAAERRKRQVECSERIRAKANEAAAAAAGTRQPSSRPEARWPDGSSHPIGPGASIIEQPKYTGQLGKSQGVEHYKVAPTRIPPLPPLVTTSSQPHPTSALPGSSQVPPRLDDGDVPLSASSAATVTTEFDAEPQTEPPIQDSSSTAAPDTESSTRQRTEQPDAGASEHVRRCNQAAHVAVASPIMSSLHSPAEAEGDDETCIKIGLHTSLQPSPQPSTVAAEAESAVGLSCYAQEEHVPQPITYSSSNHGTTVTILGPASDFRSSDGQVAGGRPMSDSPISDGARDGFRSLDISLDPEVRAAILEQEETAADAVEVEVIDDAEDFYRGPCLRDNMVALRDSAFTSSDPDSPDFDARMPFSGRQKPLDPAQALAVPSLLTPADRLSQTSVWTDFSIGSADERELTSKCSALQSQEVLPFDGGRSGKSIPSAGDRGRQRSSTEEMRASLDDVRTEKHDRPGASLFADSFRSEHRLLEVDTGEGFSFDYPSDLGTIAVSDHDRDRAPTEEDEQDDSSDMLETWPNTCLHNAEEEGELLTRSSCTPHSTERMSMEMEPQNTTLAGSETTLVEDQASTDNERKRLRQRQLVIRELIDTEEFFVRDMSVVEEIYKGTAEACPKLDSKTIKLVFRNTDEIIVFHQSFLNQLKEGAASVYTPKARRPSSGPCSAANSALVSDPNSDRAQQSTRTSNGTAKKGEVDNENDRLTSLGPLFINNVARLKTVHEAYLRASELATKRLVEIQEDPTVKVWLTECNEAARDLTTAWNLDSLLIKPMQRITKYPDIIAHLLKHTPDHHPDRDSLQTAKTIVIEAIDEINKTKKNFELVGQIVGRKRKESDVKAGLARAFGKRVDKLQAANVRPAEDPDYRKLHDKFGDDYLRLQVVLRDVELYTRNVTSYVHEFLQYLSSMELVMRLQPSRDHAHLESKWVQFNVSMRDLEKMALERHLSDIRTHVIEPFEIVIKCYGNPSLAMKKRAKRRLDFEKFLQLKSNGKKVDRQLGELVEHYEALNDSLKKELPKLSALTAQVGNICLGKFVAIQASWYAIWKEKVKMPLQGLVEMPEPDEIVSTFLRDFTIQDERAMAIGILNPALKARTSQLTTDDTCSMLSRSRSRPSERLNRRGRGLSINSDGAASLLKADLRRSSQCMSPASTAGSLNSPAHYYRDCYPGLNGQAHRASGSPVASDQSAPMRPIALPGRPGTGRTHDSSSLPRQSSESIAHALRRRDSDMTTGSHHHGPEQGRFSGIFHSALPSTDRTSEDGQRLSRASSRERSAARPTGYIILWLAASLFEFNIDTTKQEAGYPYLTYQAGELFDVVAEKGELWLAKNQDDPDDMVGWIWSKHFVKLADA